MLPTIMPEASLFCEQTRSKSLDFTGFYKNIAHYFEHIIYCHDCQVSKWIIRMPVAVIYMMYRFRFLTIRQ